MNVDRQGMRDFYANGRAKEFESNLRELRLIVDSTVAEHCEISGREALSAMERTKSEHCKMYIRNITCLQQSGRLFDLNIAYECPKGTSFIGETLSSERTLVKVDNIPSIRIAYVLIVHGRAVRQIKMMLKALYHKDHYYYIHVDSVSISI